MSQFEVRHYIGWSRGGTAITPREMRAIMREAGREQGRQIYAAAAVAAELDPRALRLLDQVIGADFDRRNDMGPDPR